MNHFVPSWNLDSTSSSQKMPISGDDDLVELLWRNGHVVMQSQTNRKSQITTKPENSPKSTQEDETPSWFQYPFEDSLEKDVFSEFFSEISTNAQDKSNKELLMPPPKSSISYDESARISKQQRTDTIEQGVVGSNVTTGSVILRSNQQNLKRDLGSNQQNMKRDLDSQSEKLRLGGNDANLSCSSGRSGCSFGRFGNGSTGKGSTTNGNKRKLSDLEETASHSEDIENESIGVNKPDKRPISTRRTRAAEVHNLSERRRRDRINEKMKALQELIPHCNKTDKASMLDEAIEYLKSLQLQVQMMWMSGGMGPMMMPAVHQFGMPPVPIPRLPFMNQSMTAACQANQNLLYSSMPFANQMPSVLGLHHMQHPSSQGMDFYPYGTPMVQQRQTTVVPVSPPNGVPSHSEQTNKLSGLTRENNL